MKIDLNKFLKLKRFKRLLKETLSYKNDIKNWEKKNILGAPPHAIKRKMVDEYRIKHNCKILVETGTYLGDMVYFNLKNFEKIYSVELSEFLANNAKTIFKKNKNVSIYQGNSGKELEKIMVLLDSKTLFWLDGHYSEGMTAKGDKNCPVLDKLNIIFKNNKFRHVIFIDDADAFNGTNDYPPVEILNDIAEYNNYSIILKNNSFILESKS